MIKDVKPIVPIGSIIQVCVLVRDSSENILSKAALQANIKSSQGIIETFTNNNLDALLFELGSGRRNSIKFEVLKFF